MNSELKKYNILWFCPIADPSGYGQVSRQYLKQLAKHDDLNIKIVPRCFNAGGKLKLPVEDRKMFERMIELDFIRDLPILTVFHLQPDNFELVEGSKKHVGLTVFETDGIPEHWKPRMKLMDEIWTFSSFCKNVFERELKKEVKVIPHGVDMDKYNDKAIPIEGIANSLIAGGFVFGSSFVWQPRKNPYCLIEAYLREFKNENVSLVLKILGVDDVFIKNEIQKIKKHIGLDTFPEILLITSTLSDEDMPRFYNSLDAYVLLSKGEGFSVSHLESMACGLPSIAPAWGGNLDFMNDENSHLVSCTLERVSDNDAMQQPIFKGQTWARINVADAQKMLRKVYDDRCNNVKGDKAKKDMQKWSWDIAGDIMHENIVRIMK